MRTSDIWQAKQNPSYVKTDKLYVDTDVPVEQMSLEEAKRGMCAVAGNDVLKCESCSAKCKFGRRIVELLKPVEMERTEKKMDYTKQVKAMNEKRSQNSRRAYLSAIASGNPIQWFVDNGYETKNAMSRLRRNYAGVTQEDAKRQLALMGIEVTEEMRNAQERPVAKETPVVNETHEPAPAPAVKAKLKVSAVEGEYFSYSLYCGQLKMTSGEGTVLVNAGDIAAICTEIAQAAEMMGVH